MESTARSLVDRLRTAGHIAYFAGGCVRDLVRDRTPKDIDIATDARPEEVQKIFRRTYAVGAHFGVIVVLENDFQFEVATFRSDGAYLDGRHPVSVHFSSAEEDARRRDFTINGMFYDPTKEAVIDFVGGRKDLAAGIIRAIGDPQQRFKEDRLRLLRAVRFATVLEFEIEAATWAAIVGAADTINEISAERIREELVKIFLSPHRLRGWDLLDQSGLMLSLLPEEVSLPLVLSVLFHDIGKPPTATVDETGRIRFSGHDKVGAAMTEALMHRLRFSRAETEATVEMVEQHMVFKDAPNMRISRLKRFMARPHFQDELELHRVDCLGSHGMLDNYDYLLRKQEEFANEPIIPPPLLRGDDLIAIGLKPGPLFGEILEQVETRQLEGTLRDREEALAWIRQEYSISENASGTKRRK
jgi:poly(A) polymerase